MQSFDKLAREARATVILSLPLVIGQVSQMLIGVADTIMIGQIGKVPLAAASFANTVIHLPFMFGIGMSIAVSVRVSQARGANDPEAARAALRHGLFVTIGIGILTVLFAFGLLPFLHLFGQKAEVIEAVPTYFVLLGFSMIPGMASMALKNHSDAMNRPWPAFWVMLGGVALNIFLNWVFIYGRFGLPRMGLEGAGVATLCARAATLAGLIVLCRRLPALRDWVPRRWFRAPDWPALRSLVKIGLPASLQIISAGALRGLNDVNKPAWIAFFAYWIVSIPLGCLFSFPLGMGVNGMWWGITVGLCLTAIILGGRLWIKTAESRFGEYEVSESGPDG